MGLLVTLSLLRLPAPLLVVLVVLGLLVLGAVMLTLLALQRDLAERGRTRDELLRRVRDLERSRDLLAAQAQALARQAAELARARDEALEALRKAQGDGPAAPVDEAGGAGEPAPPDGDPAPPEGPTAPHEASPPPPAPSPPPAEASSPAPPSAKPAARGSLRGVRLLHVDRDEGRRQRVAGWLSAWRGHARAAEDGFQALALLREARAAGAPYDAVLVDAEAPGLDGLALGRLIRNDPDLAPLRLVLLASAAADEFARQATEAGFAAVLAEPLGEEALRGCLASLLADGASRVGPR